MNSTQIEHYLGFLGQKLADTYIPTIQLTMRREYTDRAIDRCFAN